MSLRLRTFYAAAVAACLTLTPGLVPHATAAGTARYVSGGTAVARANGEPVVDEGSVVCDDGNGVGVGGFCLPFGGGDAVEVVDDLAGGNVAFQVCIDNNGDGLCTSPDFDRNCPDQIAFSHDDAGVFHNPVGPLPTGFLNGCYGGPWKGYVVFLCEGTHVAGADAHTHTATTGTGSVTGGGEGLGTFCGGSPVQQSRKRYTVGSGARYMSGGTAVVRENGQPAADEGSVVCNNGDNVGVGGFCTSFGDGDAMAVLDAASGSDVAFQVCIDNSGDGLCTSPDTRTTCPDQIAFSHDDAGNFYNPVGPLPTGFLDGCAGGPWKGYVVFLCEGTHIAGTSAHAHPATTGTGRVTTGGEGVGTFCGGSHARPSEKRYALTPQGNGDFRGGCAANLGDGDGKAIGDVSVLVAGTEPGASVTQVSCELTVDGVSQGIVLTAPNGTGATGNVGRLQVDAAGSSTALCTRATVNGNAVSFCEDVARDVVPQAVVDAVNTIAAATLDPAACELLRALAPRVNALGRPDLVSIDPVSGDATVLGVVVHDCAPFA